MPVRMVSDDELEGNSNEYDYFIGERVYAGRNSGDGIVLYKAPSEDADIHADLSADDLEKANYFIGKGHSIESNDEGVWLKLAYNKPVWVKVDDQDVETD